MSSRPPSDRAPNRTIGASRGRPRPPAEPATVPFVVVPRQRSAPPPVGRPTKLVVPGQRGPQPRKGSRRPVLVIGACVAAALIGLTAVTGLVSALSSPPPVVAPTSATTTTAP
ncbi:hypothetical protein [Pseudonocardia sp. WMMC193]|uniref:hypothetical protein n=1 Tax=Pseudonocardia sp. WMMC193 TaxID=2911965 RepID=UPI001F2772E6|nr:hypothetical protein [Pseudonocardia sp. WMMC193]MCF7551725.1 hypothetical protein [Pseudonocardia sp. WMMC193]